MSINEQTDVSKWRKIVFRTDGLKWTVDVEETNSSILEMLEVCKQFIDKHNNGE